MATKAGTTLCWSRLLSLRPHDDARKLAATLSVSVVLWRCAHSEMGCMSEPWTSEASAARDNVRCPRTGQATNEPWRPRPLRESPASSAVKAHPTPVGCSVDSTRSKGMPTDYVLPPSQRWGSATLRNATSAHGARRPSYVVIWHIAPYWLLPGYSVRHPGSP
ncbi:hypothetical protein EK21DRAFT_90883 [Setomelanomma holmii]|uniref:Uncharacterized protein n=1 Tax=Setomelanomma holmii TaxID=210430 RepID=A0A9P4H763_9PLEO|nr:hypothetical protein EK21DRAFT_90883 [Setomelanomma holmii]